MIQLTLMVVLCLLSGHTYLSLASGDTIYITTSVDSPCPAKPCITLSQFATNLTNYLSDNITMKFLQGNHSLDCKLSFVNINVITITFAMYPHSNTVGENGLIMCTQNGTFEFNQINHISISSLNFLGCDHQINSAGILTIDQSSFHGKNYSGSAVELIETTAFIAMSKFISNTNGKYRGPIGFFMYKSNENYSDVHHNNYSTFARVGGAIIATQSNVNIIKSIFENNSAVVGGAIFSWRNSNMTIVNSTFCHNLAFLQNDNIGGIGGAVYFESDTINKSLVDGNEFEINNFIFTYERGVFAHQKTVFSITGSGFAFNSAEYGGGAIWLQLGFLCTILDTDFTSNKATRLGGALVVNNGIMNISMSQFNHNHVAGAGGVIRTIQSIVTINHSQFFNNSAKREGGILTGTDGVQIREGGVIDIYVSYVIISDSNFTRNLAQNNGGVIFAYQFSKLKIYNIRASNNTSSLGGVLSLQTYSTAHVCDSSFVSNNGGVGAAIMLFKSNLVLCDCVFSENHAEDGIIFLISASLKIVSTVFYKNYGSIHVYNGELNFSGLTSITDNKPPLNTEGSTITAFQSTINISRGTVSLIQNNAKNGGAIHATESTIFISNATAIISNNKAWNNGGGLYLYQSRLICLENCTLNITNNTASMKGGGAYSISSFINVAFDRYFYGDGGEVYIKGNIAEVGGGVHLEGNAKIYVLKYGFPSNESVVLGYYGLFFVANTAILYGGAVYIEDKTNMETCDSNYHSATHFNNGNSSECSIQVLSLDVRSSANIDLNGIYFEKNFARVSGSTIFGGLLDRCSPSHFAEIYYKLNFTLPADGVTYLQDISNILLKSISSGPVRLCFCNNGQHSCNYQHPEIETKKGEAFTVSLVAVDQVNHTVPNVTIHSYLHFKESVLREGQFQMTGGYCSDLRFSITSGHALEHLIIYAEGPCKDAYASQSRIDVKFLECTCAIGFEKNIMHNENCVCQCDREIFPEYISDCDSNNETVLRKPNCWISYVNDTQNSSGYLTYSYCPFDYCLPTVVELNLNKVRGSDAQCAHNRQGLLCGACKSGHSLSLGSSHCLLCSNWSSNFAIILTSTFLVGIAMIALILILKLTVASGVLSGIIFYANIVNASSNTFLPFPSPNIITVTIAWLNLELGIDTCFFNGMDAYWKMWIELIFPAYLIVLVVLVIYMCKYSTKFAQLIGKNNPVATLATLILLSYTKFLRTIITSLSFTILYYPDHSSEVVWLLDATMKYLQGKHIALFIAAIIILFVGTVYTLLLLTWQWIHASPYQICGWIDHQKLDHFIEAYNTPYTFKHRYWTGFLLLARVILYLAISINMSNDPAINLFAVGLLITIILLLKLCVKVYKNVCHDYLETVCFCNVLLFSLASLYFLESEGNQTLIAYISGSVTILLVVVVFAYHAYTEVIHKLCRKVWKWHGAYSTQLNDMAATTEATDNETRSIMPTSTVVDAPPTEQCLVDVFKTCKVQNKRSQGDNLSQDSDSDIDDQQPLLLK